MKQAWFAGSAMALSLFVGLSLADTTAVQQEKVIQSGFIGLEAGEIVHGVKESDAQTSNVSSNYFVDQPLERLLFQYVADYNVNKHVHAVIGMECQLGYSYPLDDFKSINTQTSAITVYPDRAEGMYTLDDLPLPLKLQFGFGYFPFRTDPDVKNLGEYMFRTGTYPTYVINNFNRPYARLLGVRASATAWDCLHGDVLLTSSTQYMPLGDGSLTFLASYNLDKVIEVGAGIQLASLFSYDSTITTPTRNEGAPYYINQNGDTSQYTFKATKVMGRFSFDPKPLLPEELSSLLGKGDSRFYSEICCTGWENYKNYDTSAGSMSYYANRWDRTLFMFGYNVPTFKILDVLSFELEHKSNRYPNSLEPLENQTNLPPMPIPVLSVASDIAAAGSSQAISPWYWTIYLKKTFLGNYALIAQAAHDHMRPIEADITIPPYEDVCEARGDWWYNIRLNILF